jgi:hypothetical protein
LAEIVGKGCEQIELETAEEASTEELDIKEIIETEPPTSHSGLIPV